jgi:hypothetical protein
MRCTWRAEDEVVAVVQAQRLQRKEQDRGQRGRRNHPDKHGGVAGGAVAHGVHHASGRIVHLQRVPAGLRMAAARQRKQQQKQQKQMMIKEKKPRSHSLSLSFSLALWLGVVYAIPAWRPAQHAQRQRGRDRGAETEMHRSHVANHVKKIYRQK